jgi:phage terminase large subunit-like protein
MSDGRWEVDGRLFATVDEAYAQAEQLAPFMLMVGASLGQRFPKAVLAGAKETRHGLPLLRELAEQGRVLHDGTPDLDEQMFGVRVRETATGLSLVPGRRSDLLRALCWALRAAVAPKPVPAIH